MFFSAPIVKKLANTHASLMLICDLLGVLRSMEWQFVTDVSGHIGPLFKGEEGSGRLFRNVGNITTILCLKVYKSAGLIYSAVET